MPFAMSGGTRVATKREVRFLSTSPSVLRGAAAAAGGREWTAWVAGWMPAWLPRINRQAVASPLPAARRQQQVSGRTGGPPSRSACSPCCCPPAPAAKERVPSYRHCGVEHSTEGEAGDQHPMHACRSVVAQRGLLQWGGPGRAQGWLERPLARWAAAGSTAARSTGTCRPVQGRGVQGSGGSRTEPSARASQPAVKAGR